MKNIFELKMKELTNTYSMLTRRLSFTDNQNDVHTDIEELEEVVEHRDEEITKQMQSKSELASKLASLQKEYSDKLQNAIKIHSFEDAALYAEYAIDFAKDAMNNALLAAFKAINLEKEEECND